MYNLTNTYDEIVNRSWRINRSLRWLFLCKTNLILVNVTILLPLLSVTRWTCTAKLKINSQPKQLREGKVFHRRLQSVIFAWASLPTDDWRSHEACRSENTKRETDRKTWNRHMLEDTNPLALRCGEPLFIRLPSNGWRE